MQCAAVPGALVTVCLLQMQRQARSLQGHNRHTVEMAEQHYIQANDHQRRARKAAKMISAVDKLKEMRKTAARALGAGLEAERVN
jgi:CRISPR/Cas system-associated endonuclease Cas1